MKATIKPGAGEHIKTTCAEACRVARMRKKNVSFRFNDIFMVASPNSKPQAMVRKFDQICRNKSKIYQRSPAVVLAKREREKLAKREREKEVAEKRVQVDELLNVLPLAIETMDWTMRWLAAFVPLADDVGVSIPCDALWAEFYNAGYTTGEHVGQPSEWFDTREKMGRYIIGQVMDYLKRGYSPHPMTAEFTKRYFNLPEA